MELCWGVLIQRDAPCAITSFGNEGLYRVDRGIEIRLPWRHHPGDGAYDNHFRSQKAHLSDFPNIRGGLMMSEDSAHFRLDRRAPVQRTPIETYDIAVFSEQCCHLLGAAFVPALQYLPIQCANFDLASGGRVWCLERLRVS